MKIIKNWIRWFRDSEHVVVVFTRELGPLILAAFVAVAGLWWAWSGKKEPETYPTGPRSINFTQATSERNNILEPDTPLPIQ